MSLSYLDGFDRLTRLRVSSAERRLFSKAGYHGLGHTLLSESVLPLLRSPISARIVGQKRRNTRSKTSLVSRLWTEHRVDHRHCLFRARCSTSAFRNRDPCIGRREFASRDWTDCPDRQGYGLCLVAS